MSPSTTKKIKKSCLVKNSVLFSSSPLRSSHTLVQADTGSCQPPLLSRNPPACLSWKAAPTCPASVTPSRRPALMTSHCPLGGSVSLLETLTSVSHCVFIFINTQYLFDLCPSPLNRMFHGDKLASEFVPVMGSMPSTVPGFHYLVGE